MPEEPWTILKLLQRTTRYFKDKGVAEPRASAEILLAHILSQDRLFLYLNHDRPMEPEELSTYRACVRRRVAGEPIQYITGFQEFWSLAIRVSPDVLIPRRETELLVDIVLDSVRQSRDTENSLTIIDLGTGSGAISIALALELPGTRIIAVDLSLPALKLARENVRKHQVEKQIHFVCGDMLTAMGDQNQMVQVIVTNPPYVGHTEMQQLPREIRDFEPRHALDGGLDGLSAISQIIKEAPSVLGPGGKLIMEMGAGQSESVSSLVVNSQKYLDFRIFKDYSGIERVLVAKKA
jgi:release factor glutamine methyltransferase